MDTAKLDKIGEQLDANKLVLREIYDTERAISEKLGIKPTKASVILGIPELSPTATNDEKLDYTLNVLEKQIVFLKEELAESRKREDEITKTLARLEHKPSFWSRLLCRA